MNYLVQPTEESISIWIHTNELDEIVAINWIKLGPRSVPITFDRSMFYSARELGPEDVPIVRDVLLNNPRPEARELAAKTLGELNYD
jgi:hypothetical protein